MKKLIALLLAAVLLLSFTACAKTEAPESTAAPPSPSADASPSAEPAPSTEAAPLPAEEVTINWAVWDENLTTYYQPLIDAYREKNPNITIKMVDLGSSDYQNALLTQLTGGADLDVVCVKDIPGYANLVNGGYLLPLNGEGVDTTAYGGLVEQITVNGSFYALPFRSDHWVVFYNKDLFDAAGVEYPSNDMTVEDYDALCRALTSGTGAEKVYGGHFHTWRSAASLFAILDGKHTIVEGSYDFMKPTYEWVVAEQNDGIVQDYGTLKATSTHYSGVFFNNQCAMMNMGSWFIPTLIDKIKTGESLATNWGIVKYPHPAGAPEGSTLGTITSVAVNAKSEKQAVALDFVKFVSGPEGAAVLAGTGSFPAIKTDDVLDILAKMDGFPSDENSKAALQASNIYLEMPMHDKAADIEGVLNEAHDAIMTGAMTIDEAIEKMNTEVGEILNNG